MFQTRLLIYIMPEPVPVTKQEVCVDQSLPNEILKKPQVESKVIMLQEDAQISSELLDYYRRACKWPEDSVFPFESNCTNEFLETRGYKTNKGEAWRWVLDNIVDDSLSEEYSRRYEEYVRGQCRAKTASFAFSWNEFGGYMRRWIMEMGVANDEKPSMITDGFLKTLELFTGIKVDGSRLIFRWSKAPRYYKMEDEEVSDYAIKSAVTVGIIPREGHPHNDPWDLDDVIPLLMKHIVRDDSYFPLIHRYRIWTVVWKVGRVVRDLIEANPDFIDKAHSLGIRDYVFNDVLSATVPANPAIELIPLEILESVTLLKGLVGYMYDNGLIANDAGHRLVMDGSQYKPPTRYIPD